MNDRNLTHNPQIDQLITTLTPKSAPESLSSTWPVLHENAIKTMKIANNQHFQNESSNTLYEFCGGALVMTTIIICFLIFVKPRRIQ